MRDTLPIIIQDMIDQMNNKKNTEGVRHNYFTVLMNVKNEINREVVKFENAFISNTKKLNNKTR